MKTQMDQIRNRFREKLAADHVLSSTYRGRIMLMLDAAIHEVFGGKQ